MEDLAVSSRAGRGCGRRSYRYLAIPLGLAFAGCEARFDRWDRASVQMDAATATAVGVVAAVQSAGPAAPSPSSPSSSTAAGASQTGGASPASTTGAASAPVVEAGADAYATSAMLRVGVATDALAMTYQWAKSSGPGALSFSDSTQLATTISADTDGVYVVTLTATNSAGSSTTSQFTFTWQTTAPTPPSVLKTTGGSPANADTRYTNQTTVYLVWSGESDSVSGLRDSTVQWYSAGGCAGSPTTVTGVTGSSYSLSVADGDVRSYQVTTYDRAGLAATSACSSPITVKTVPPTDTTSLALTAPTVGAVHLTVGYGATTDYASVELRRVTGNSPPACGAGTLIKTYTAPFAGDVFIDDTGMAGQAVTYRLCIFDLAGNVTSGQTQSATTRPHILFATATTYTGTLTGGGGVASADAACTAALSTIGATSDILTEPHWAAVISDSTIDAEARVIVSGKVLASDSVTTLATSRQALWTTYGINAAPAGVGLDETGAPASGDVWTGSDTAGLRTANHCSNWGTTAANGDYGNANVNGFTWINSGSVDACTASKSVYCISQPAPVTLTAFTAVASATAGEIDLSVTPPTSWLKVAHIGLYRALGASAPDAACSTGLLTSLTVTSGGALTAADHSLPSGQAYSYLACAFDSTGNVLASSAVTNVTAP